MLDILFVVVNKLMFKRFVWMIVFIKWVFKLLDKFWGVEMVVGKVIVVVFSKEVFINLFIFELLIVNKGKVFEIVMFIVFLIGSKVVFMVVVIRLFGILVFFVFKVWIVVFKFCKMFEIFWVKINFKLLLIGVLMYELLVVNVFGVVNEVVFKFLMLFINFNWWFIFVKLILILVKFFNVLLVIWVIILVKLLVVFKMVVKKVIFERLIVMLVLIVVLFVVVIFFFNLGGIINIVCFCLLNIVEVFVKVLLEIVKLIGWFWFVVV